MYEMYLPIMVAGNPLTSTLTDDFTSGSRDATKWIDGSFTGGVTSQSGGKLILTPATSTANTGAEYDSVNLYDLTGSYIFAQVLQVASQNCETILMVQIDGNNRVYFDQKSGTLSAFSVAASVFSTVGSIAYNPTTMAWWRIRESGGTTFWDYSADGVTWTNLVSLANPIDLTAIKVQLGIFDGTSDAAPGAAWFDNFNLSSFTWQQLTMPPSEYPPEYYQRTEVVGY